MSFLKGVHPFNHYPFSVDDDEVSDVPTPRKAIAFYAVGRSTHSREPVTADYAARYLSRLTMLVEEVSVFTDRDEVEIGGRRYEVDGLPSDGDWRRGPFAAFNRLFGGEIQLKRAG